MDILYNSCCADHSLHRYKLSSDIDTDQFAAELARMVEGIWRRKKMPKRLNKAIIQSFAKHLWSAVEEGTGKSLTSVLYDSTDYNMLKALQTDVYHFSAAKNYQQLKALTEALIGEDGKLRTKRQFIKAAYEINDKHVGQWLDVEHDTAIGSAQMVSIWADIQANKEVLDVLEFDVVLDSRTTDICRKLHGVRVRLDHPIVKTHYPPNHFLCRTTVRMHAGGAVTKEADIVYPEIPKMFQVNLAAEKLVFPPAHPYYVGLPEEVKKSVEQLIPKEDA